MSLIGNLIPRRRLQMARGGEGLTLELEDPRARICGRTPEPPSARNRGSEKRPFLPEAGSGAPQGDHGGSSLETLDPDRPEGRKAARHLARLRQR